MVAAPRRGAGAAWSWSLAQHSASGPRAFNGTTVSGVPAPDPSWRFTRRPRRFEIADHDAQPA